MLAGDGQGGNPASIEKRFRLAPNRAATLARTGAVAIMTTDLLGAWCRATLGNAAIQLSDNTGTFDSVGRTQEGLKATLSVSQNLPGRVIGEKTALGQIINESDRNGPNSDGDGNCITHDVSSQKNEAS
jgi:hypothetical protein